MKMSIVLFCAFFSSVLSSQINISHLKGSWYIQNVEQASNSAKDIEQKDLESALEALKEGYFHFDGEKMGFFSFSGDFLEEMDEMVNYSFIKETGKLEITYSDYGDQILRSLKITSLTANKLVYQVDFREMIIDYHFTRATPNQLICGNWGIADLSIQEYINSLPTNKKQSAELLEDLLFDQFITFYFVFRIDNTGYAEVPAEEGGVSSANFTWELSNNTIELLYEDGSTDSLRYLQLNHNHLVLLMPAPEFDITFFMDRE